MTAADERTRWSSAEQDGNRYLMLRYRPVLNSQPKRERRDWVFLFESSGSRDPLLARTQVEVIRSLLNHAEHDDTFAVLTVGTRVHKWTDQPQPVTASNVANAVSFLEQSHLIGALNLQAGLQESAAFLDMKANPYLVHVGAGVASLGEQRADVLISQLPKPTRYVGVAVGKKYAAQFMKVAAEKTGGYFTQINPDESVAWRGFDLASTLNTPRWLDLKVLPTGEVTAGDDTRFLTFTNAVAQGYTGLVIVGVLTSVVSAYYYLRVVGRDRVPAGVVAIEIVRSRPPRPARRRRHSLRQVLLFPALKRVSSPSRPRHP